MGIPAFFVAALIFAGSTLPAGICLKAQSLPVRFRQDSLRRTERVDL